MGARRWVSSAAVAVALGVAACGGDDDEEVVPSANLERYCEVTEELGRAAAEAFGEIDMDPETTRREERAAGRRFVREHGEELERAERLAPSEIRDEVEIVVDGLRARGGAAEPPGPSALANAGSSVRSFQRQNCDDG